MSVTVGSAAVLGCLLLVGACARLPRADERRLAGAFVTALVARDSARVTALMTDPSHDAHASWLLGLAPEYLAFDTTLAGLEGALRFRGAVDGRADYRIQSGAATDECDVALQISVTREPQPRVSYVTVMPDLMVDGRPFCLAGAAT